MHSCDDQSDFLNAMGCSSSSSEDSFIEIKDDGSSSQGQLFDSQLSKEAVDELRRASSEQYRQEVQASFFNAASFHPRQQHEEESVVRDSMVEM